jgi:hypothetical protein
MLATGLLAEVGFVILVVQLLPRCTPIVRLAQQRREHVPACLGCPSCAHLMCSPVHKAGIGRVDPNKGISIRWVAGVGGKVDDWPKWGLGQGVCLGSMIKRGQGSAGST